jgi:hypothetical protein
VFYERETAKPNKLCDSQISGMLIDAREYSKMTAQLCNGLLDEYGIMVGFIFSKICV